MICASKYALISIGFGNPVSPRFFFSLRADSFISSMTQLHISTQESQMKLSIPFTKYLTWLRLLPQNEHFSVVVCLVDIRSQLLSKEYVRKRTIYISSKMRVFCPFFEKYFSYLRFFVFFQSLYLRNLDKITPKIPSLLRANEKRKRFRLQVCRRFC